MGIINVFRNGFRQIGAYIDVVWGGEADGDVPVWNASLGTYVPGAPGSTGLVSATTIPATVNGNLSLRIYDPGGGTSLRSEGAIDLANDFYLRAYQQDGVTVTPIVGIDDANSMNINPTYFDLFIGSHDLDMQCTHNGVVHFGTGDASGVGLSLTVDSTGDVNLAAGAGGSTAKHVYLKSGGATCVDVSKVLITASVPTKDPQYTVSGLPTSTSVGGSGPAEGMKAYATDGRKVGEGAGVGTGVPVYYSNGQWRVYSTDAQVQA